MTPEQMEQDFHFLRGQVQRLSRLIDALESSPLLIQAMVEPEPEPVDDPLGISAEDVAWAAAGFPEAQPNEGGNIENSQDYKG